MLFLPQKFLNLCYIWGVCVCVFLFFLPKVKNIECSMLKDFTLYVDFGCWGDTLVSEG